MISQLKDKVVEMYVASNSGAGVDNGNHGARTSVNSTIIVKGTVVDFDEKFIHLKNTVTTIMSQVGVDFAFNDISKLKEIGAGNILVSLDKILLIHFE